jgi:precorrin-6B methylase 2
VPADAEARDQLRERVEQLMQRLFVDAAGATLRNEDRRKAIEVAAFLEEIRRAVERTSARDGLTLVDAAAGKSYLGIFAAHLVLSRGTVITIEREPRRAAVAERAARALSTPVPVEVRVGDVDDARMWPERTDVVVALHACGAAADVILDRAMAQQARHVLVVPCCTSEAVAAMPAARAAALRTGIPRHAAVRRRYLQAFIDAERTLRLEAAGYETEVVELCPPTVTPHNLLWRARRVGEPERKARAQRERARLLDAHDQQA